MLGFFAPPPPFFFFLNAEFSLQMVITDIKYISLFYSQPLQDLFWGGDFGFYVVFECFGNGQFILIIVPLVVSLILFEMCKSLCC